MNSAKRCRWPTSLCRRCVRPTPSWACKRPRSMGGFTHGVNDYRACRRGPHCRQSRPPGNAPGLDVQRRPRAVGPRTRPACRSYRGSRCSPIFSNATTARTITFSSSWTRSEAFVLETCGRYWALLECGHTRVVTDAAMIRQDWRRLAPGLADCVIEKGWWQDDGSKIDFVRCLSENTDAAKNAQKRWGRASLALAQQQGAIDLHYLRHMLADHYVSNRDLLAKTTLASSFMIDLKRSGFLAGSGLGRLRHAAHRRLFPDLPVRRASRGIRRRVADGDDD